MTPRHVTGDEVRDAVAKAKISRVQIWRCSICHHEIGYVIGNEGPCFHSECSCSFHPLVQRTWDEVAHMINRQTDEKARRAFMVKFGMEDVG